MGPAVDGLRPRIRKKKSKLDKSFPFLLMGGFFFFALMSSVVESDIVISDYFVSEISELSEFEKLDKEIDSMMIHIRGKLSDDPYVKTMHDNGSTSEFREGFEEHLLILKDELAIDGHKGRAEAGLIYDYRERFEVLKREYLAGAPLGEIDQYTLSDGEVLFDHGVNMNSYATYPDILKLEKDIRKIPVPDNLDDYREISESIANVFNVEVKYGLENLKYSACGYEEKGYDNSLGVFCSGNIDTVYIGTDETSVESYSSSYLVDVMKHELAHRAITVQCQTSQPIVATGNNERVASSYAVIFYAANRESLQGAMGDEYKMNDESDRIARAIHDQGTCNERTIKEPEHLK